MHLQGNLAGAFEALGDPHEVTTADLPAQASEHQVDAPLLQLDELAGGRVTGPRAAPSPFTISTESAAVVSAPSSASEMTISSTPVRHFCRLDDPRLEAAFPVAGKGYLDRADVGELALESGLQKPLGSSYRSSSWSGESIGCVCGSV